MKKLLSLLLALLIMAQSAAAVFAQEGPYLYRRYVSVGDSISAGFTVPGTPESQEAVVPFLNLNYNCSPRGSFPILFGEKLGLVDPENEPILPGTFLFEEQGGRLNASWGGQSVQNPDRYAANLGASSYRLNDVYRALTEEDFIPALFERVFGTAYFHETMTRELSDPDTDLVTVELGSNDLMLTLIDHLTELGRTTDETGRVTVRNKLIGGVYEDVMTEDGPRQVQTVKGVADILFRALIFGELKTDELRSLLSALDFRDPAELRSLVELLQFIAPGNVNEMLLRIEEEAFCGTEDAAGYDETVSAIRALAPAGAQFAYFGVYNPFGNSLLRPDTDNEALGIYLPLVKWFLEKAECRIRFSRLDELAEVLIALRSDASPALDAGSMDAQTAVLFRQYRSDPSLGEKTRRTLEACALTPVLSAALRFLSELDPLESALFAPVAEYVKELLLNVLSEIAYPILYIALGVPAQNAIDSLNGRIRAYAEERGEPFIDPRGIPNEANFNVHPNGGGHAYLAAQLYAALVHTVRADYDAACGTVALAPTEPGVNERIRALGSDAAEAAHGQSVTFTVTPREGCTVESVRIGGEPAELKDGRVTAAQVSSDLTVQITFCAEGQEGEAPDAPTPVSGGLLARIAAAVRSLLASLRALLSRA